MALSYLQARRGYMTWYELFMSPLVKEDSGTLIEMVERRAEGFNFASEELTAATKSYLQAERHEERIAAVDSLLHQIEGDLEVANILWTILVALENEPEAEFDTLLPPLIKSPRLDSTYNRTRSQLPARLEQTARYYQGAVYQLSLPRPGNLEAAIDDLVYEIEDTISVINECTERVSLRLIKYLMFHGKANWRAVQEGVELLRGTQKAGDIGWGFEDKVRPEFGLLAGALRTLLVNIVEKVLVIVEKNDLIRYVIADWLSDVKDAHTEDAAQVVRNHINQLYQTETFRTKELPIWLRDATNVEQVQECADHIMKLGDNYERLTLQIKRLGILINANSFFRHPLLQSAGFAVQVGLIGTLVFAGYDHLDEGSRALNITQGIREYLIGHLPVSSATLQLAEHIKMNAIRV
ncbi:MAG: hypothetical protein KJ064_05160 [Anaerolineae bacterium]|nr:hypothetical protein [Anaerolineae bacterium]